MVGLQGREAFAEDRAVALGVSWIRNRACSFLRRGLWFDNELPPGTGGVCSQAREARRGRVIRQIVQNGLHVLYDVHVCAGGSGVVSLVAVAGRVRGVGSSHVDVEDNWRKGLHRWWRDWWGGSVEEGWIQV